MSKIYKDSHSLYVKVNGSYFRPILPNKIYSVPFVDKNGIEIKDTISQHNPGDNVKTHSVRFTSYCKVGNEIWHHHGAYLGYDWENNKNCIIPSEESWHPFTPDEKFVALYLVADATIKNRIDRPSRKGFLFYDSAEDYIFSQMCSLCRDERSRYLCGTPDEELDENGERSSEYPACFCEWEVVSENDFTAEELTEIREI